MARDTVPPAAHSNPPSSSRRVLVADDEPVVCRAIARALEQRNFEVVQVNDGNAAVQEVINSGFDVIVSDIGMPGSSGIDLLRIVRAYDLDVPVILVTGTPDVKTAMEAVELGAIQYFTKPFELSALQDAVERASRLHRLARIKRDALSLVGEENVEAGDRAGLAVRLDSALETLWIAFQPIVSVVDRRVVAYEALMRTAEPSLPHPGAVLGAAERLDRSNDVGRRVREVVSKSIASAPADAMIFVNILPDDLLDADLASASAPLSAHAERVVLELTERAALENVKDIETRVDILRYMGYRIAIDDLGAGYAGLTSFATLEPEFVKLDMALIRNIHTSPMRQKLVSSLTSVCKEMKKSIIAEGIEINDELLQVERLGCDLMQGYLFAKPAAGFSTVHWG